MVSEIVYSAGDIQEITQIVHVVGYRAGTGSRGILMKICQDSHQTSLEIMHSKDPIVQRDIAELDIFCISL